MAKRDQVTGQLGLFIPDMGEWKRPEFLPDWMNCPVLTMDVETKDNGLNNNMGAGWAFKNGGHLAGFSVCNGEKALYFPMRHPDTDNFPVEQCHNWLKAHIERPNGETIFHYGGYDLGWIEYEVGELKPTKVGDTHAAGVIANETRYSYSLENLCKTYDIPGKNKDKLREAAISMGLHPKRDLWRLPARFVAEYGEGDVIAPWRLWYEKLKPELERDDLMRAYRLEADLLEVCMKMRKKGIRVNEQKVEDYKVQYTLLRDKILHDLSENLMIGRPIDMGDLLSSKTLAVWFDIEGINYPRTKQGSPSFESDWMERQNHWLPQSVAKARKYEQAAEKFLTGYIQDSVVNGRIHAEIHQLRGGEEDKGKGGGTITYRFSYSGPPLQQMPARDPDIGMTLRDVFEPEEGEEWVIEDYSQQEPRLQVHFATLLECTGWEKAYRYYHDNPKPDYHQMVAEMTEIPRPDAKVINLSLAYGMQLNSLAERLGLSRDAAKALLEQYHSEVPFVNSLTKTCKNKASMYGFIRLIDGARSRFDLWRPNDQWYGPAYDFENAKKRWPSERLSRADTRDAMNRLIQGSAARQTKRAMKNLYDEGYLAMLQMHDDLNFSLSDRGDAFKIKQIMIEAIPLKVPMQVDIEIGPSWGAAKKI